MSPALPGAVDVRDGASPAAAILRSRRALLEALLNAIGNQAMDRTQSYLNKTFLVADPDARIRTPGDLMAFERYAPGDALPPGEQVGNFKRIAQGTVVRIAEVSLVATGSAGSIAFARTRSNDGNAELGWTSTRNFKGGFVNETLGTLPPAPGAQKFGPNAVWSGGSFKGQITLAQIVGAGYVIKRIALETLDPYLDLMEAAAQDGVQVAINSGFRSYPEQKVLYDGFIRGLPGFNKAARPGTSNHQNGIAFDIAVGGASGDPIYDWLKQNAPARGFIRTVNGEPWHWEYDTAKAAVAVANHTYKTDNVVT
jgi:hypothetical protein